MKKISPWYIVFGLAVLVLLYAGGSYNGFITSKATVDNKWADVETQYQRRADLIPNIVSTVKGAANFEQKTFTEVTQARSAWAQAKQVGDRGQEIAAASGMDGAIARLLVTVENYPQLRATDQFRDLTIELEGTENRISVARRDYNAAVMNYNVKVQRFPGNLWAKLFGFAVEKSFQAENGSEKAPAVDFSS